MQNIFDSNKNKINNLENPKIILFDIIEKLHAKANFIKENKSTKSVHYDSL